MNDGSQGSEYLSFIRIDEPKAGWASGVELPSEVIKLYAAHWGARRRTRNRKPHDSANRTDGRAGATSQRRRFDQAHAIAGYQWHTIIIH